MRRNLVIARVGAQSLHRSWFDGLEEQRNWDLYLSPYQAIPPQPDLECMVGEVVAGPKWSGLRQVLRQWDGWRHYDQVWLPDDDIRTSQGVINQIFEVAAGLGLRLYAPALDADSCYAHFITKRNPNFFGRRVGFVEIMVPGFERATLESLMPTLDATDTGWGWGLDVVWPKLLDYEDIAVLDGLAVTHARPVGTMRDEQLFAQLVAESDKLLDLYDCRAVLATFGAFGPDLTPLDLTPDQLLVKLVDGWRYLIDKDPRVLSWVADHHLRHFPADDYPTGGTPSV